MKTKAFTLIELMLVVVIIGILATIGYPRLETFRLRAQLKEVENTVEMLRAAEKYYRFKTGAWYCFDITDANYAYVLNAPDDTTDGYVRGFYANVGAELDITLPPGTVLPPVAGAPAGGTITYEGGPQWLTFNDFHIVVRITGVGGAPPNWLYFWSENSQQGLVNGAHPYSAYINP